MVGCRPWLGLVARGRSASRPSLVVQPPARVSTVLDSLRRAIGSKFRRQPSRQFGAARSHASGCCSAGIVRHVPALNLRRALRPIIVEAARPRPQ